MGYRSALGHFRDPDTNRLGDEDDPWGDGGHPVEIYEDPTVSCRPSEKGRISLSRVQIDRFQDLMIVRLMSMKISARSIGRILNVDDKTVVNRYNAIPEKTRRFYGKEAEAVGILGGAWAEAD